MTETSEYRQLRAVFRQVREKCRHEGDNRTCPTCAPLFEAMLTSKKAVTQRAARHAARTRKR